LVEVDAIIRDGALSEEFASHGIFKYANYSCILSYPVDCKGEPLFTPAGEGKKEWFRDLIGQIPFGQVNDYIDLAVVLHDRLYCMYTECLFQYNDGSQTWMKLLQAPPSLALCVQCVVE
jgi:hypothetical protein